MEEGCEVLKWIEPTQDNGPISYLCGGDDTFVINGDCDGGGGDDGYGGGGSGGDGYGDGGGGDGGYGDGGCGGGGGGSDGYDTASYCMREGFLTR